MTPIPGSWLRPVRRLAAWLTLLLLSGLGGCGPYTVRGTVIAGNASMVTLVKAGDPRLDLAGLDGAVLELRLDPRSLGSESLGGTATQTDGSFEMPLDVFGAGFLEYELGVLARSPGYNSAEGVVKMPGPKQRLLIILARGADRYQPKDDPLKDLERFAPR